MESDTVAIERLARYRLKRDLTFERLADEMTAAGYPIKQRTLHLTLTGGLKGEPRERTRFKIREFVARLEELEERKASRRKAGRGKSKAA